VNREDDHNAEEQDREGKTPPLAVHHKS